MSELNFDKDADIPSTKKKKKMDKGKLIRCAVLIVAACIFVFSAYNLLAIYIEDKKDSNSLASIDEKVIKENPSVVKLVDADGNVSQDDFVIPFEFDFDPLLEINPEAAGYIYIPPCDIRLPFAQTTDNDFYLSHSFDRQYSKRGTPFIDARITGGMNERQVIIYGHNNNNGTQFSNLIMYFNREDTYDRDDGKAFFIYDKDNVKIYIIFSAYYTDPLSDTYTYNFSSDEALQEYAERMKANSEYPINVDVSNAKQVVTLSTCSRDGKTRFILQGIYAGSANYK